MQKIRWFSLIALVALALIVAIQNHDSTQIQLLWLEQSLPLSVLMLSATAIGFLLGALTTVSMLRSRKKPQKTSPPPTASKKTASQQSETGDLLT